MKPTSEEEDFTPSYGGRFHPLSSEDEEDDESDLSSDGYNSEEVLAIERRIEYNIQHQDLLPMTGELKFNRHNTVMDFLKPKQHNRRPIYDGFGRFSVLPKRAYTSYILAAKRFRREYAALLEHVIKYSSHLSRKDINYAVGLSYQCSPVYGYLKTPKGRQGPQSQPGWLRNLVYLTRRVTTTTWLT